LFWLVVLFLWGMVVNGFLFTLSFSDVKFAVFTKSSQAVNKKDLTTRAKSGSTNRAKWY